MVVVGDVWGELDDIGGNTSGRGDTTKLDGRVHGPQHWASATNESDKHTRDVEVCGVSERARRY